MSELQPLNKKEVVEPTRCPPPYFSFSSTFSLTVQARTTESRRTRALYLSRYRASATINRQFIAIRYLRLK